MANLMSPEIGVLKPVPRLDTGVRVLLYGGFVLTGAVTTLLGPALPILSSYWSLSDGQAGRLFAVQFAGATLAASFTCWLLPKLGYRVVLSAGYLLMAVGIGGLGVFGKFFGALAVFGYGIGQGVTIPASNLLISDWNPQRRASALNLLNLAWGLGAVACPFFVASANHNGNLTGWLLGLAGVLGVGALGGGMLPSTPHQPGQQGPTESWSTDRRAFAFILGLLFFLYVGTETALGGWVASHAKRTETSSTNIWMFAPALFWGLLLLGRALAPLFLRLITERKLIFLDLALASSGVVTLLTARSGIGVAVGSAIAGLGLSSVFPINIALMSSLGSLASRAAGPIFAVAGVGGAVLPWLVGSVAARSGSLRVALAVPLVAVLLMLALQGWDPTRLEEEMKPSLARNRR
jgi:fucose permease